METTQLSYSSYDIKDAISSMLFPIRERDILGRQKM